MRDYRIASFFSGIGGMDLGALGGFEFLGQMYDSLPTSIRFATDFDARALETYNENFGHEALLTDIRELGADAVPTHDILTGGFPCQSFSVAATNPPRLGYKDVRGQLFFEMVRMLRHHQPRVFIAENVKGLLSANKGQAFPLVLKEFEDAGYKVTYRVLNAADFGVPQKRQRVFIVGFKEQVDFDNFAFPEPLVDSHTPIRMILEPEELIDESYFFSDRAVAGMRGTKNSISMNKGRAQDPESPCNTVGAHLAKVSLNSTDPVFLDSGRYRMFTPREVARIQSFPDAFALVGSRATKYRGLGNAVAPVVMWHVTKAVVQALDQGASKISKAGPPTEVDLLARV